MHKISEGIIKISCDIDIASANAFFTEFVSWKSEDRQNWDGFNN